MARQRCRRRSSFIVLCPPTAIHSAPASPRAAGQPMPFVPERVWMPHDPSRDRQGAVTSLRPFVHANPQSETRNREDVDDRGREDRLTRSPLPPNRACGSPAHGSPVGGSPLNGLARPPSVEPHGKLPESSEEDARSSHPPSLGSPSCQHTIRTHRRFRPAVPRQASPGCLARRTDTCPGLDSHDTPVTYPPSCGPSLHGHYPASSLLWPL